MVKRNPFCGALACCEQLPERPPTLYFSGHVTGVCDGCTGSGSDSVSDVELTSIFGSSFMYESISSFALCESTIIDLSCADDGIGNTVLNISFGHGGFWSHGATGEGLTLISCDPLLIEIDADIEGGEDMCGVSGTWHVTGTITE